MASEARLQLNWLIEGESDVLIIIAQRNWRVSQLKEAIQRNKNLKEIDPHMLQFWKVNIDLAPSDDSDNSLSHFKVEQNGEDGEKLTLELVREYWSDQPMICRIHIVVKVLATSTSTKTPKNTKQVLLASPEDAGTGVERSKIIERFLERLRPEIREFLSDPRQPTWMPPETVDANTREFYHNLAIPSINHEPNLLLHNLGDKANLNGDALFQDGKDHRVLCNTPGAGKTALIFNGLCSRWGFYFVAIQDTNMIGARDLELAIEMMSYSPGWIHNAFENSTLDAIQNANNGNETIVFKLVYKVLLTRWILFKAFIDVAREQHAGNLPPDLKRDWLLFQILPVVLIDGNHPFPAFMDSCLEGMSMSDLQSRLAKFSPGGVLGPAFDSRSDIFFYILDEAQAAGATYIDAFADVEGKIHRPVLRPIIKAWEKAVHPNIRFIVSGTGFLLDLFGAILKSSVGKRRQWKVMHQTGDFINQDLQKSYITRYLPPGFLSSPSGTSLVSRMYEWLRGRHRFTATFIEQLLAGAWTSEGPSSPHKLLNAYVRVFTNFNPIDCDSDWLAIEPDVNSPQLEGFPWDRLKQDKGILQELSTSLYTYITRGKYPMWQNERQDLVEYGVARFMGQRDEVIIEEPMALVGIMRFFEKERFTVDADIRARLQAEKGKPFEEAVLLSCTRLFRVGAHLSDVFQFYGEVPDWAHQRGWIVSRQGQALKVADIVVGDPLVPSVGVAHFAENPNDVKDWITSKSNVWCIPGALMGPDLMAWLQLEDGKLILLLIQAKCHLAGNKDTPVAQVTAKAIRSLIPRQFYHSSYHRSAETERSKMLEAINTPEESFTGSRYNVLRVIVSYPLDAGIDPEKSKEIASALNEDDHPLATFKHALLLSSLATHDDTCTALSSLASTLKRAREDDEHYPNRKLRKKLTSRRRIKL